jgi:AcrR family transcriptional regulator
MPVIPPLPPGLRERQKQERRRAISDAATALFLERGFDAVTMAEVAEAAGVSIKTIFNYFGSKEELFLDREAEAREATVAAITDRPAGATITDGILTLLVEHRVPSGGEGWEALDDAGRLEGFRAFLTTWHESTALRARHLLVQERLADTLIATLSAELRIAPEDVRIRAMAMMVVAVMHERHRVMAEAVLEGAPVAEVRRRVREFSQEAVGRVATAFPDLDPPRLPRPDGDRV